MRIFVRVAIVSVIAFVLFGVAVKIRRTSTAGIAALSHQNDFIVHEWGTFTSIAGKDGVALEWRPLNGATDLPKFVHTMQTATSDMRHPQSKADLAATIRIETTVIHFSATRAMGTIAHVKFPTRMI